MNRPKSKTLTLRLTPQLFQAAQEAAHRREVSLNTLVSESLEAALRQAEEQTRYDEYTLLGQDLEECDVSYALAAQSEVMLRERS